MSGNTYKVTITFETDFAPSGNNWVARDESGAWRAHCAEHFAKTASEAVAMMFHANEVISVNEAISEVTAIIDAGKPIGAEIFIHAQGGAK